MTMPAFEHAGLQARPSLPRRPTGRARNDESRRAILDATLKLLETRNLQQISIESIAREAGVGKATIYRWWTTKAAIVIEAFARNHVLHTQVCTAGDTCEVLTSHIRALVEQYSGWPGKVVRQILAEGQFNAHVLNEFRERFFQGRRSMVRDALQEGRRRGELRSDLDVEMLMDMLYASVYLRLVVQHQPLDQAFGQQLSDTLLKAIRPVAAPV